MITLTRGEAQEVLDALEYEVERSDSDFVPAKTLDVIGLLRARLSAPERNCTRSHPHENMDVMCELRTEIARLTNENARLKSQPEPEPVTDKYLMEVECTKCGAKQDGVLTVTVPPQPEPEPVAWEPKVERLYSPEGLLLWERVKYTPDGEWQSLREKNA